MTIWIDGSAVKPQFLLPSSQSKGENLSSELHFGPNGPNVGHLRQSYFRKDAVRSLGRSTSPIPAPLAKDYL
jgi:hypothetical protein